MSIDAGGDLRLAHELGAGWAKLLAMTGRRIDAATAERLGIVQQVTEPDDLVPTAMALAREIAANAPLAVQSIKRTIDVVRLPRPGRGAQVRGAVRLGASSSPTTCPPATPPRPAKQPVRFEGK